MIEAQELAVFRFSLEQLEAGLGATPSIIYAAICHLRQQEQRNPPSLVWFQQWLKRNPTLHTIKTKPIANVRLTTHSEEDLKTFFVKYQNTLSKYGIRRAKYIYNMDESGVRVGCPTGETVVVPIEIKELYTASPENRKSITIIETISADGSPPLPPVVICPGEKIMEDWVHDNLSGAEVIAVSQTGYTNESIALSWLDHFIKHVGASPKAQWHILLIDGHITHHKDDFILKCHEYHIVPFVFPSHLTHVLQPLDVGVFRPWKHNKAIHNALHSLDMEYTISSFFRDLSAIRDQTFQSHTIKNSFKDSGMFPVSFKRALKKMRHYNARRDLKKASGLPTSAMASGLQSNISEGATIISTDEDDELELPVLPSTYFECQKGMGEWIDKAETFSPKSKAKFQQWAEGTQICLAEAQLQQESYRAVQSRIKEEDKRRKTKSRRVIQKGGIITAADARLRKNEKDQKQKLAAIKKARKDIQIAVNKAKAALHRGGVDARKAEKERKKQLHNIQTQGGVIPPEMLIAIMDPEKNPTPEDLEALQAPPDLLQALLILEPNPLDTVSTGDLPQSGANDELEEFEIILGGEQGGSHLGGGCDELDIDSDSGSSFTSCDSIARNADFITFN